MTTGFRIKGRPWEDCGRELVECEEEEEMEFEREWGWWLGMKESKGKLAAII